MTRGILIVGNEAPALTALAAEARGRVAFFASATLPNRFGGRPVEAPSPDARPADGRPADGLLEWNPASAISARSLVIGARNRLGKIDEAILVCSPIAVRRRADELVPAEIDAVVDDLVKGWFLLTRELALEFRARGSGTLAFVLSEGGLGGGKDDAADLVGASVAASFRALAQGMLSSSFKEPWRSLAFSSEEAGEDASFAAFVFRILDEGGKRESARWHKFGKGGLFGLR